MPRIWQGKALVGAMLIPAMYYLMYEIMEHAEEKVWYVLAAVCAAGCGTCIGKRNYADAGTDWSSRRGTADSHQKI